MKSVFPGPIKRLAEQLAKLPGVGKRSSQRLAFHLARAPEAESAALADAISSLADSLSPCEVCGNIAAHEEGLCPICSDARRERSIVCVVEQPDNVLAIERTACFRGLYHVLGGAISPLHSIGPDELKIESLLSRLTAEDSTFDEVILATNPTIEGDATALYIQRRLADWHGRISRPATGLPVGGELEYVDSETLSRALEGRRTLSD